MHTHTVYTCNTLRRRQAVDIPFKGAAKNDLVTYDMTWSRVYSRADSHIVADVDGLDLDTKYTCAYTY